MPPESTNHEYNANTDNGRRINSQITNSLYSRPGRPRHAALREFIAGLSIYCSCIFLPSLPRYLYFSFQWVKIYARSAGQRLLWYIWVIWRFSVLVMERWGWIVDPLEKREENENSTGKRVRIRSFLRKFLSTSTAASLWEEFNQQERDAGNDSPSSSSAEYTWGFGWSSSAYPAITMVLFDIQILTMVAVTLAIIRVWFIHILVPEYLAPRRLEALTRCKSTHLLSSSSYKFDGEASLENAARQQNQSAHNPVGLHDRLMRRASYHWYRLRPTIRRALGHEPTARYNNLIDSETTFRRSNSTPNPAQDLFSAPRYATAMFRLTYTSASCFSAYYLFHSAVFWPREVFGSHKNASTRNCWDLSGSVVALGTLDEDYDNLNSELKYFFLAQAAYQLHSLCFHLVSMGLLLLYGEGSEQSLVWLRRVFAGKGMRQHERYLNRRSPHQMQQSKSRRLLSMKTSMQSYIRPMLEHFVVLALLVSAYLFSGLRRLGSLGIFSLEFSSVFLQLLQVCIYAPEDSWLKQVCSLMFMALTIIQFRNQCSYYLVFSSLKLSYSSIGS